MQVLSVRFRVAVLALFMTPNAFAASAFLTAPASVVAVDGVATPPASADNTLGHDSRYPISIGGEDVYSDYSLKNHEEGSCVLRITISAESRITSEVLETKTGLPHLDEACLKLFHGQKMATRKENGVPVETVLRLSIAWLLNNPHEVAAEAERARLVAQHISEAHVVPAGATGREVRVFFSDTNVFTGDRVRPRSIVQILFTSEPCNLPIDGASKMRREWTRQGIDQVGCWYPTLDEKFVSIDGAGRTMKSLSLWAIYPRALLQSDGSAFIIEPDYDSNTFINKVAMQYMNRLAKSRSRRENEAP